MGKGKLKKFRENESFSCLVQPATEEVLHRDHPLKGRWKNEMFHNDHPIVLELGCGKGEYTVALGERFPEKNHIGIDIKGARLWKGAKYATQQGLGNVAFLRTNIEIIDRFFSENEVDELWLTFSDPQMKNPRKRLTSTFFMERYRRFLVDGGTIHLKTDSNFLFTYTTYMVEKNQLPVDFRTDDLYNDALSTQNVEPATLAVQTYYEQMWLQRGLNIRYMRWHLPHSTTLEEPDVEIELDEYRSYHRTKRSSLDKAK